MYRYGNIRLEIPPQVFHPGFFFSTGLLLRYILTLPLQGKRFLELGAGSGLISIQAAKKGAIVTATDINPVAIDCLRRNCDQNNVTAEIILSDLFAVIPEQPFDIIAINPPYYKLVLYYALLFFMSNTHLVALLLAGSLHLYFLLLKFDQNKKINKLFPHVLLGILVFLPALYFISPPSDSGLTVEILANKFDQQHLGVIAKSPLRTFIPVPAWWEHNFWNTQFLLALQGKNIVLRLLTLLLSVGVLGLVWLVLKDSKKSLTLFIINLLLTFIVAVIFPLTTQRYIGFIFIGFIAAYWLRCYERPVHRRYNWLVNILLGIQVVAGVFVVSKDIRLPFSNFDRVNELIKAVPPNEKIVTDYWCVNTISAFSDSTFYCIGLDSLPVFLQWKKENNSRGPGAYFNSVKKLFERENLKRIYLISTYPTHIIFELDPQLEKFYKLTIIEKREGAIDKWGNLYLYEISSITPSSGVLGAVRSTFAHINLAPREIFDKYKGVPRLNFL